ncbi:oxidoreductase family protein [Colletotrichum karsti]|uniref:Oxidoreductase family protein n=1 Tax=Colletotrichum karsti TaxID=1095194 RepID=A0A9P6LQJ1_9PEZI|nr:oxidoreductase family protein [Colletotrichum karsti]KAF9880787.1 oxidoreductase family protein [Colletotrichum karsti]
MSPIRVGIIGLSAKPAAFAPGAWASTAFLPSIQNSPEYTITALCNSSLDAARRSRDFHKLPETTKVYGDPEQLANDPDVDLVIVSVVVTHHLKLALPALQQKKQVFVEWPLGKSVEEAEQMAGLARADSLKTIVGLQARGDPVMAKLKQIVDSGEIGDIKNVVALGTLPAVPPQFWTEDTAPYLDISGGATSFQVIFGHFLDSFTHIVGAFQTDTISSILKTDVDEVAIYSSDRTSIVKPSHPKTAPDHILVQGLLKNGAPAMINFRTAASTVDDVGIRWVITGSKGEIETTTPSFSWQAYAPARKLKIKSLGGEVREVDLDEDLGVAADVGQRGVNTALILDAFAKGRQDCYADFEAALQNHRLLEHILKKSKLDI